MTTIDHRAESRRHQRLGRLDLALAALAEAPQFPLEHAFALVRAGRPADAKVAAAAALADRPGDALAHLAAGMASRRLGDLDTAIDHFDCALAADANLALVVQERAAAFAASDRVEAGLVDHVRAVLLRHGAMGRTDVLTDLDRLPADALAARLRVQLHHGIVSAQQTALPLHFRDAGEAPPEGAKIVLGLLTRLRTEPRRSDLIAALQVATDEAGFGLRVYATDCMPGDRFLAEQPAASGVAGLLTQALAVRMADDGVTAAIDLDWGTADTRSDVVFANRTPVRMTWGLPTGLVSISVLHFSHVSECERGKSLTEAGQTLPRDLAQAGRDWTAGIAESAETCAALLTRMVADTVSVMRADPYLPWTAPGGAPPPLDEILRASAGREITTTDLSAFKRGHTRWLARRPGDPPVIMTTRRQMERGRLAVVTPYGPDEIAALRDSQQSVREQGLDVRHYCVGVGVEVPPPADAGIEYVPLPIEPGDGGCTALAVGTHVAVAQGCDAVAYLAAGNAYREGHLQSLWQSIVLHELDLAMSRAALRDREGREYRSHVVLGNVPVHHDSFVSTFMLAGRGLSLAPLWSAVPVAARAFATGMFRSALRARGLSQLLLPGGTAACVMKDAFSWQRICARQSPPGVEPLGFKEAWLMQANAADETVADWLAALVAFHTNVDLPPPIPGVLFDRDRFLADDEAPPRRAAAALDWLAGGDGLALALRHLADRVLPERGAFALVDPDSALPEGERLVMRDPERLSAESMMASGRLFDAVLLLDPRPSFGDDATVDAWLETLAAGLPARSYVLARMVTADRHPVLPSGGGNGLIRTLPGMMAELAGRGLGILGVEHLARSPDGTLSDWAVVVRPRTAGAAS